MMTVTLKFIFKDLLMNNSILSIFFFQLASYIHNSKINCKFTDCCILTEASESIYIFNFKTHLPVLKQQMKGVII